MLMCLKRGHTHRCTRLNVQCVTKVGSRAETLRESCSWAMALLCGCPLRSFRHTECSLPRQTHAGVPETSLGTLNPLLRFRRQVSGLSRLGSRTGEVCADTWPASTPEAPHRAAAHGPARVSPCLRQFSPEPQCSGPSVLGEPTTVCPDRQTAGGTAGEAQHFSPGEAQHLDQDPRDEGADGHTGMHRG